MTTGEESVRGRVGGRKAHVKGDKGKLGDIVSDMVEGATRKNMR